ncbi:MAG: hypothetical protein JSU08_01535 [Acidobacteria bacterium]|nr:hypothetical protein [Acidobacteriota bacterium]
MDRASKLLLTGWAVAALLAEFYYVKGAWHAVTLIGPIVVLLVAGAVALDRRTVAVVALVSYLFPVLIWLGNGRVPYHVHYSVVWLGAVLAAVFPDAVRGGWRMPVRWRVPLVCWAAGVALSAPVIAFRAVDFRTELLFRGRLPFESLGGFPLLTVGWTLHVALVLIIGVLWFDWICGQDEGFFLRWVAMPMGIGAILLATVAMYQMFVDVGFLNPTVYAGIHRASGTMMDANVSGVLAALWIGGWGALAARANRPTAAIGALLLLWCAVWATGSRTAFGSAVIISALTPVIFLRSRVSSRVVVGASAVVLVATVALVAANRHNPRVVGPLARLTAELSSPSDGGLRGVLEELWNRNGYGLAATRAIEAYPAFGIGVGAFHEMASEFGGWLPPDNAQNWYRHQLVELGLVGSVGWIVFVVSFGWWVIRRHAGEQPSAWGPRASILGIATISLLGMPGQDPAVSLTFWTFCGWFLLASARPAGAMKTPPAWAYAAAGVLVIAFVAGTTVSATGPLRFPARIQRAGGDYLYGFYWPEPDGEGGEYRWARRVATAVVPVETRSLELTLRVNHADLAADPVTVKAWVDGRKVIDTALTAGADSVTVPVLLPERETRMLVDTQTSRVVVAPPPDGRELGVMVRWRFRQTSR